MGGATRTDFGARLRRLREAAGLTQEELASRAGLTAKGISALERGERTRPHPHTVRSLANALDLPPDERGAFVASAPRRTGMGFALEAPPAGQVPVSPTPIVGRDADVARLLALITRDRARLVTLSGPGGVGKTRLALEVAGRTGERFPDGTVFLSLAPVTDPDLVVPTLAHALDLREGAGRSSRELLHDFLRDKTALLVLDNFEHLRGAVPEVAALLASCPSVQILATSRAPLRLRGEQAYPVVPLAVPSQSHVTGVEHVAGTAAAELFVQRAREAHPAFSLTERNAGVVGELCRRLGGLPLALELAGAQVRFLGLTELLARLDQALDAGGARDLPERQRTMRATLDWSYALLTESEQRFFRRLAVFAGGFTLEAADVVCAVGAEEADGVLRLLGGLTEQSLVMATAHEAGEVRYGMLEPIREYARDKLRASGEERQVRAAHAAYVRSLAQRAERELKGPHQGAWLEVLDRENDNLRAALSWLLEEGEIGLAADLCWWLWHFWSRRGHLREGLRWVTMLLAHPGPLSPACRARAVLACAAMAFVQGEVDRTLPGTEESIVLARDAHDEEILGQALLLRGVAAASRGELHTAETILPERLAASRRHGDAWSASVALTGLTQMAMGRGDVGEATRLAVEMEAIARAAGDWAHLATSLNLQGLAAHLQDDAARAAAPLRESIRLAASLRDAWTVAYDLTGLAAVAARQDQLVLAVRLFGALESMRERMGVGVSWGAWHSVGARYLAQARARLAPVTFDVAWFEGRSMTLDEAIAV